MSLQNAIVIDKVNNLVTLSSLSGANTVDVLTYTDSGQTVTFGIRPAITISTIDYFTFIAQLALFQTAIVQNFSINQLQTQPFRSFIGNETFISFINEWNLEVTVNSVLFVNNVTPYSTAQTSLYNRVSAMVLNFSEWYLTYQAMNHYALSLHGFLGI